MASAQRRSRAVEPKSVQSSADAREIEKFAALAEQWWNPKGAFAALQSLNPLRLEFVRTEAALHFRRDPRTLAPFGRLALVDIGCGGGLLAEPLARQGFTTLGIDASAETIAAAAAHARTSGAAVSYLCATAETLKAEGASFDVVLAMEVIEHVSDRAMFLESTTALLRPGGLLFVASISRTLKSLALAKFGAEYVLSWIPPGTHDWSKFVSPDALSRELQDLDVSLLKIQGVSFDPLAWEWRFSSNTDVNYMLVAKK